MMVLADLMAKMAEGRRMLTRLNRLVNEIAVLHSKLILVVGRPGCGKSALLAELANQRGAKVMNVGAALGKCLAKLPQQQRAIQANVAHAGTGR
jgi:SpoVK/Ycf46/Vps4 family AAA+-type ATPase